MNPYSFFIVYIIISEQGERGLLFVCDLRSLVGLWFRLSRFPLATDPILQPGGPDRDRL